MKTKEQILQIALDLFNTHGISAISSRHISDKMSISYGNLCYHFPKKSDIIIQLYLNMQTELDKQLQNLQADIYNFDFMMRHLRVLLQVLYRYKFIFLDMVNLTRKFSKIRLHAIQQFELRKQMLIEITEFLTVKGYMRKEKVRGHNAMAIHSILLIINACISDAEIFYKGEENKKIDYYLDLLYSCFRNNLTQQGFKAFNVYADRFKDELK